MTFIFIKLDSNRYGLNAAKMVTGGCRHAT
jgi:hypothetical protein